MKQKTVLDYITEGLDTVVKTLAFIGCFFIGLMALVVVINIIGRFFFEQPLKGTLELVEAMMIILAFFAICYTAAKKGHVAVTLIVERFPKRARSTVQRIGFFLSAVIMGVISYQAVVNTIHYIKNLQETTPVLYIPVAPFRLIMALGCIVLCLQLLRDAFKPSPRNGV